MLFQSYAPIDVLAQGEMDLRRRRMSAAPSGRSSADEEILSRWVRTLELGLLVTALAEAYDHLGIRTVSDLIPLAERVDAHVRALSGVAPERVLREDAALLTPLARQQLHASQPITVDASQLRHSVQSLLIHCPIVDLENAGERRHCPELAHRCRVAFEGLRTYLARTAHPASDAIRAASHAFAEGRLSIDEVGALLGVSIPDAVSQLEEHGYGCSMGVIRLGPGEREDRPRAIRADRLARAGEPDFQPRHADRDTIASQRIEDVDARPWLRS